VARVEIAAEHLDAWLAPDRSVPLAAAVRSAGFRRVVVDLRGFRSGSLNVLGGVVAG
jgi:PP-loop superfamily ATP-utilizing enzyme